MSHLGETFALILAGLCRLARGTGLADRAAAAMLFRLSGYCLRAGDRLQRLYDLWRAGRLPAPRAAASRPRTARTAPPPAQLRLTRRKAWLRRVLGPDAGNFGTQITHLLLRPDAPAFLAAVPQAGRILRPVLHLLGTQPPAELALPPRPPRPARPKPPPEPPIRWGKYDLRAIRRYRPGPIRGPGLGAVRKTA